MFETNATPTAAPAAEASEATDNNTKPDQGDPGVADADAATQDADGKPAGEGDQVPPKKEITPEEREIKRLRRRVDNLTRKLYTSGAKGADVPSTPQGEASTNPPAQDDTNESVTLTRSELDKLIDSRARNLAPTIAQQEAERERRTGIVDRLAKDWGTEKFDAYAADLDDAFGGLADGNGRPKPATDAIFEADNPRALIEYLADPDHAAEAEALGRMGAVQAGRAVAKLEAKLASKPQNEKPQPSKASAPIESARGTGNVSPSLPSDSDPIDVWIKKERARVAARKGKG